jgi:UDP-N-acetylmuramoyl-tripeptide--D-alanyl-D-alanine ligase
MDLLKLFLDSTGVSTDTRKIQSGNLFFALKGSNFNGNLYVEKALQLGASFAVSDEYNGDNPRIMKVQNGLLSLQTLAKEYVKYLNIPILAITGSNGKTTTKELIAAVLGKKYKVNFTKGQ